MEHPELAAQVSFALFQALQQLPVHAWNEEDPGHYVRRTANGIIVAEIQVQSETLARAKLGAIARFRENGWISYAGLEHAMRREDESLKRAGWILL